MNNISIDDFQEMSTDRKKSFFTKEILQEWDSLRGAKEVKLQKGKGKVLGGFYIFGWEPAIMLKFKYISKNRARVKDKKEFWDSVIWHENVKLSDTDILDPKKYPFDKPFRILTKEESKTAGQSKLVRNIMKEDNPNNKKENEAATKIQAQVRGRQIRKVEEPNGDCTGTNKKCPDVDKRVKGKKMSNKARKSICNSYTGCKWNEKQKGGRKKKKRRKAFPSRRKNNRKNRTKKRALSK